MILRMRKACLEAQVEALRSELASLTQQQFTQLMCQRGKLSVFRSQLTRQSLHLSLLAKHAIPVACFLFHLFLFRSFNDLFIHYALIQSVWVIPIRIRHIHSSVAANMTWYYTTYAVARFELLLHATTVFMKHVQVSCLSI